MIQQLEGNVLQPAIQETVLNMPSILIFAVPVLAVLKVLFDFFRGRLYTEN